MVPDCGTGDCNRALCSSRRAFLCTLQYMGCGIYFNLFYCDWNTLTAGQLAKKAAGACTVCCKGAGSGGGGGGGGRRRGGKVLGKEPPSHRMHVTSLP